jgi:hypothetical protein
MKKLSILFVTLLACLGCTTYNNEIKNNSYAPVASMQILRNAPLMKTAESILFFDKDNIANIDELFKDRNNEDKYFWLKKDETSKLYVLTKTIDSFLANKNKIFTVPVYISFRYMQDLVNTAGSNEDVDLIENKTTVTKESTNLKQETERKEFFKNEIIKNLYLEGLNIVEYYDKAQYVINITTFEDGVMDKFKFGLFYVFWKTSGIISLKVEIIDIKEKKVILEYYMKNRSIYKDTRYIYFIPKIQMTEDLEYEY